MVVKKWVSSGAKSPCCTLFAAAGGAGVIWRLLVFSFLGEDGGRKAAGKKTKISRSFPGVILHPWLEIARGTNELLTAALSCLDIFTQVESGESSTA